MKIKKVIVLLLVCAFALAIPASAATVTSALSEECPWKPMIEEYESPDLDADPVAVDVTLPDKATFTDEIGTAVVYGEDGKEMPYCVLATDEAETVDPASVNISENFTVAVGKSWERSFNTGVLFADPHNAFKVIVSDVTGKYKIIITDNKGYEYESPEYSNKGATVTIVNAWSDRTFKVNIVNVSTTTLTGHVKLSSYYNS